MIPLFPQTGDADLIIFNTLLTRRNALENRYRRLDQRSRDHRTTCKAPNCMLNDGSPNADPCVESRSLKVLWEAWRNQWGELHRQLEELMHILHPDPDYPTTPNSSDDTHPPASTLFD